MSRDDLTTYEVWVSEGGDSGQPTLVHTYQDEIGLTDNEVKIAAVAHLQSIIDKIETPGDDTVFINTGVIHPPAISVRRQRHQDNIGE